METFVAFDKQKIFSFKMIDMNDNEDNMKNWRFFVLREVNMLWGGIKSLSKEVKIGDMSKQFKTFQNEYAVACTLYSAAALHAYIYAKSILNKLNVSYF